ncbi:Snf7 [Carpediemonas membranifera]|uniref:Snf7 n=1 Tax=Carpediemonas membranifera TaxID=201153 RepID=A0A8J6B959_9EUKA|nr:Snf7 [Carpediemonas membranifera]QNO39405.1 vacuolar protein sorting 20-like D [Carpediemonas membranifera]|eukprot:KAG9395774.1 Snf7 [Carpediemonas membranifera]
MPLGKGKNTSIPDADNLSAGVRRMDTLMQARNEKIEKEKALAKQYLKKGDKRMASLVLRRIKNYERLNHQAYGMQTNLTAIQGMIQQQRFNVDAFNTLKTGQEELSTLASLVSADDVYDLMDGIQDRVDDINAVTEALSNQEILNAGVDTDVSDELAALEAELAMDEMPSAVSSPAKTFVASQQQAVSDELDDLEALMC